ncbi:hypothetical protein DM02DRAFT_613356 [Periconia macrospinosa]|uniref:UBC core domain-containing protein n=1 Tax=Periconia macrospinosa TaxID=97972 RepID=A0A2V1DXA0_9PLEO|nr:hypothetical protein DM02DRAFT_613356 [Periconia macrospinosa]
MKHNVLKRVWAEVRDVNNDFFNLRTKISPDTVDNDATRFYFIMVPNDGAMAHLNLAGCVFITDEYPTKPPVVHLYTPTGRYNVDVYRGSIGSAYLRSTMCFDILRSEADGGTWKPEYTLSSLFASLMSAIVSYYVTQQYGGERPESVSMGRLNEVKQGARKTFSEYADRLPTIPRLPLVEATPVEATPLFSAQTIQAGYPEIFTSKPIFLQTGSNEVHSFAVNLSNLHSNVIFSVVLSSSTSDLVGNSPKTILVRNGVTATAARKRANETTRWFYHGKPMNDGDMRLHVSIGRDQMTFAYYEKDSEGKAYVHGDCPVSRLSEEHIGDVKGIPFYVNIYTKDKTLGKRAYKGPVMIDVLDIEGKGYIHESMGEEERNLFGFEVVPPADTEFWKDEERGVEEDEWAAVPVNVDELEVAPDELKALPLGVDELEAPLGVEEAFLSLAMLEG